MKLKNPVSRRQFLRSSATAIALPYLVSLPCRTARAQAQAVGPRRFVTVFFPNGTNHFSEWRFRWSPEFGNEGLGRAHVSLQPLRNRLTFIDNLTNHGVLDNAAHVGATAAFMTGNRIVDPDVARNSISADQVVANAIGDATPWRSLELGTALYPGGVLPGDGMWSTVYNTHLSWSAPDVVNPAMHSPRAVFDRLFGPNADEQVAAERRRRRGSILDYIRGEARRIQGRVNPSDRRKLDQYLTAIREVERRIDGFQVNVAACGADDRPGVNDPPFPEHTRQMMDLLVLALQCDMTRVLTYMMDYGFGNQDFSFLVGGAQRFHHNLTHHEAHASRELVEQITTWYCDQFAYLVGQMDAVQEENGTLLDNTMLLFGSGLGSGRGHSGEKMPLILAGGGAGTLNPGGVVDGQSASHATLLLSMIQKMGVNRARFGDANAPLAGL